MRIVTECQGALVAVVCGIVPALDVVAVLAAVDSCPAIESQMADAQDRGDWNTLDRLGDRHADAGCPTLQVVWP